MEHIHHRPNVEQREIHRPSADAENIHAGFPVREEKKNDGEVAMYLVENAHEAIIDKECEALKQ